MMLKDIPVTAIQAKVPLNKDAGEAQVARLVKRAASNGAELIGLPEDCIAPLRDMENGYDPFVFLSELAQKHQVYLFGATTRKETEGFRNIGFLFDKKGGLLAKHYKIILTPPEETDGLIPGNTLTAFETEFGKMSLLVCKDAFHRYAAWFFEELRKANVDVVLVPSYSLNVTKRSVSTWVDSLKALAKWFDVYIVAPGTIGPNMTTFPSFGHALIVSPLHGVLVEGSADKEEILNAILEAESLMRTRNSSSAKWQSKEPPRVSLENGE